MISTLSSPSRRAPWLGAALAAAVVLFFLLAGLADAGLWDPVEVHAAELARRLATARAPLPTRDDLGAGELPFDTIALAFRLFGVSAWAGRVGLATWGVVGVAALALWLARFADRRAAIFGAVILASLPLYFVQSRTLVGDVVTMATGAVAFAALAIAVFDREARGRGLALALAIALAALVGGLFARGLLVGVALPTLTVGLAWLLARAARGEPDGGARLAGLVLVVGLGALAFGTYALVTATPGTSPLLVGVRVAAAPPRALSFDGVFTQLGHALFPWSAFLPFAVGRVLRRPASVRESQGRLLLLTSLAVAVGISSLVATRATVLPFAAPASLAAVLALAVRDLEVGAPPSPTMALGTAALGALLVRDFLNAPETGLAPFVVENAAFPSSFTAVARPLVIASAAVFLVVSALVVGLPRSGNGKVISTPLRGAALVAAGVFAGLVFRVAYYPRLAEQLSPKGAYDTYARLHHGDEPLAILGVDETTASYSDVGAVTRLALPSAAAAWLAGDARSVGGAARRWLALRGDSLPEVNALFRARSAPPANLPVLDGRSSAVVLASNRLAPGEVSASPLDAIVLSRAPATARPVDAVFGDALAPAGWEVTGLTGETVPSVKARKTYHLRVYIDVRAKVVGGYCTFVHIEHTPTRFAVEHTAWSAYPMAYWNVGDVLADDYEISLPAQFRPGSYAVYFGVGELPCTDDRRMKLTRGANDGHERLLLGSLTVTK